jgi:hypothetical protein
MAQTVIADDQLFTLEDEYTVGLDALGRVRISPTDVSQFIRLDQCERYLRLRLHDRFAGDRFMFVYGFVPSRSPFSSPGRAASSSRRSVPRRFARPARERRVTAALAEERNRYGAELCTAAVVVHAAVVSQTEAWGRAVLELGKPPGRLTNLEMHIF